MDCYEILGVRPQASTIELELAYKGRRSQYHPDRYAQSDPETVAWATERMREVNEAFEILSSPDRRRAHDAQRTRSAGSTASSQASGQPDQDGADVPGSPRPFNAEAFTASLLRSNWDWDYEKVHVRPNIPRGKLAGAISSYAPDVEPSEVLILLDDTVFGGAKEGLLVTQRGLYARQKFEAPVRRLFSEMKSIAPDAGSRLMVNGYEFFKAIIVDHSAILALALRLSEAAGLNGATEERRREQPATNPLDQLHRHSLETMLHELGDMGQAFMPLIDSQMRRASGAAQWFKADAFNASPGRSSLTLADKAEACLVLFIVLHFLSFARYRFELLNELGDQLMLLYQPSQTYMKAYRSGFQAAFGCRPQMSEEDLLMVAGMFFNSDGETDFDLVMPRAEAVMALLSKIGLPEGQRASLINGFDEDTRHWMSLGSH